MEPSPKQNLNHNTKAVQKTEKVELKRRYPRRDYQAQVGVLVAGHYLVCQAREIGEGGLSFVCDFVVEENQNVVLTFKIPNNSFFSVRSMIKSVRKENGSLRVGVLFLNVSFELKRQIRAFVAG